jgi:hypothetical protein
MNTTPTLRYNPTCAQCGESFPARRPEARYCDDACRKQHNRAKDTSRAEIIAKYNGRCAVCGAAGKPRRNSRREHYFATKAAVTDGLYVRAHPKFPDRVPLCGKCHVAESHRKFHLRVPKPGKGYAKRLYRARRAAQVHPKFDRDGEVLYNARLDACRKANAQGVHPKGSCGRDCARHHRIIKSNRIGSEQL